MAVAVKMGKTMTDSYGRRVDETSECFSMEGMRKRKVHGEMGRWILIAFSEIRNTGIAAGWSEDGRNCKLSSGHVEFEQSRGPKWRQNCFNMHVWTSK